MKILVFYNNIKFGQDATGNIVHTIFKNELFKNDEIFYFGFGNGNDLKNCFFVNDLFTKSFGGIIHSHYSFFSKLNAIFMKAFSKLCLSICQIDLIKVFVLSKELKHILKINKFDCIVTCGGPIEVLCTASKFMFDKHIVYLTDIYSIGENTRSKKYASFKKWENKLYEKANVILTPFNFVDDYKSCFPVYNNKFFAIEFPALFPESIIIDSQKKDSTLNKISLLYLGSLTGSGRKCNYLFELFSDLDFCELNIYSKLNKKTSFLVNSNNFHIYDPVDFQRIPEIIASSNATLVIDNGLTYGKMIPSKVLNYVSFCKPIIILGENKILSGCYKLLMGYPNVFYYEYGVSSKNELIHFLKANCFHLNYFDRQIYSMYSNFAPSNVAAKIRRIAFNDSGDGKSE